MKRKRSSDSILDDEKSNKLRKLNEKLANVMKTDHKIIAMLKEMKVDTKTQTQIDEFIKKLHNILTSDEIEEEFKLSNTGELNKMVTTFTCKRTCRFLKPVTIEVAGGIRLGTAIRSDKDGVIVDVAVVMPKKCLDQKDYLNERYLYKRAIYVAHIANFLSKKELIGDVKLEYERGIHVKPRLIIKPADKSQFVVSLSVKTEKDSFKWKRFNITMNNVRPSADDCNTDNTDDYPATPHYNSWILSDLTFEIHEQRLEEALKGNDAIRDAIILLKIWLHQRELDIGFGGFSGFIMTSFVVYLLSKGKLSQMAFSYQVFQNTLAELAKSDWTSSGISMATGSADEQHLQLSDFHSQFQVVFVDTSGYLNLCADMNKSTFDCVRYEAELSVQLMEAAKNGDLFENLWMTSIPFIRKYDEVFRINFEGHMDRCPDPKKQLNDSVRDLSKNYLAAYLPRIYDLIKRALGKRIRLLTIQPTSSKQWSVGETPPCLDSYQMFGLLLEKQTAYSQVDRGPLGNSEEAKDFRNFWGEKAELRRFQDGATCEAVIWPSETMADKRTIIRRIVRHVIIRHTSAVADDLTFYGSCLDRFLQLPQQLTKKNGLKYATGEEEHEAIMKSFSALSKEIRSITDEALNVTSVQGISPTFSYTEVFPALSTAAVDHRCIVSGHELIPRLKEACPPFTPSLTILCLLERSGKWPDDINACRKLKQSFLARLMKNLETKFGLMSILRDGLYVYKDGYVFHILLGLMHEITLLRMTGQGENAETPEVRLMDTKESLTLERQIVVMPLLTSHLHGLQMKHSSFSCVCRLAKRWLASQMMFDDYYIDEMALELIVASIFVSPGPVDAPGSPVAGFMRFLHLMATHDWHWKPIIINFNNELTESDCDEIKTRFIKERSTLPSMFIATPTDRFSQMFTKKHPTTHILTRIAILAKQALSVLENQFHNIKGKLDLKKIFHPSSKVYDVVIHLSQDVSSCAHFAIDVGSLTMPNYSEKPCQDKIPVYDYDPTKDFLNRLRALYDEFALFFYDVFGGKFIGVIWKPTAFRPLPLGSSLVNCRTFKLNENEEGILVPDTDRIIRDFEMVSPRSVKSVEVRRQSLPLRPNAA